MTNEALETTTHAPQVLGQVLTVPAEPEVRLNDDGQRFGTKAIPREVNFTIGKGANGGITSTPGLPGAEVPVGTKAQPRLVTTGVVSPRISRVVTNEAVRTIRIGSGEPVGAGLAQKKLTNTPISEGEHVKSTRHLRSKLTAITPLADEVVLVIPHGAALALRSNLSSGGVIRQNNIAVLLRVIADGLARPKGQAGTWGEIELAIVVKRADVPAVMSACRRVRPAEDARRRLLAAFEQGFARARDAESRTSGSVVEAPDGDEEVSTADGRGGENTTEDVPALTG